jgi:putative transposase
MARMRFTLGTRYVLQGQVYIVRQVLVDNRLLVENQSFGGQFTVTQEELCAAWARDELRFEVHGPNTQRRPESSLATSYTFADFQHLSVKLRDEAWRRYQCIRPLLLLPPAQRTRQAIAAHAAALRAEIPRPEGPSPRKKRSAVGEAISRASLERWMTAFDRSGYDIRSLVPATDLQGGKGKRRLNDRLERLIAAVLAECAAAPMYRTAQDVYLMIVNRVAEENRYLPADQQLALPGSATVYRRIRAEGAASLLRKRASRKEAQAENTVLPGPSPTRILERVEIDHTMLDVFLVDEEDRLPIGRPTLTYALDTYSGFPFGLYVGFEPASYRTVQHCLLHGILPKGDTRMLYGTQHPWSAFGLPETLVIDNGKEFIGRDLDDACGQLGIILERMPVRTPWFKGSVERFFRTNNTGLIHTLPGTTFSNVLERGDYDVFQHACISLSAFWKILHLFLLDIYAQRWHEGVGGIPAKVWAENLQAGFMPCLHNTVEEVRILLYRSEERTVQRSGIDFESLRYQSPDLSRLRSTLPQGARVRIKYDPADLSALYVFDPSGSGEWLRVPAVDTDYTHELSLWKHRVIRSYVLRHKQEVDIYALAAAKQHIQEIVVREFAQTRKNRGRKTAARFLDIEMTSPPSPTHSSVQTDTLPSVDKVAATATSSSEPERDAGEAGDGHSVSAQREERADENSRSPRSTARSRRRMRRGKTVPSSPAEPDVFDTKGWGGDYNLPQHASQRS